MAGPKKGESSKSRAKQKKVELPDSEDESLPDKYEDDENDDDFTDTVPKGKKGKGKRPALGSSAPPKKRQVRNRTGRVADQGASLSLSQPIDHDGLAGLGLSELAIELGNATTPLLNRFLQFIRDNDIRCDVLPKYTPNIDVISHILSLPAIRNWKFLAHKVQLYNYEQADGLIVSAWRIQAVNDDDPNANPVDLFTMHTSVGPRDSCPPCRPKRQACNVKPGQACAKCAAVSRAAAAECIRRYTIAREQGHNIITEKVCSRSEKDKVIQLGQIKVDIMNRAPIELETDKWKTVYVKGTTPAVGTPDRAFIDVASLLIWKQKSNPAFDLGTLGYSHYGEEKSVWGRMHYPLGSTARHTDGSVSRDGAVAALVTDFGIQMKHTAVKATVPYAGLDMSKVDQLQDLEAAGYHIFSVDKRDSDDPKVRAATQVLEHIMFTMACHVGTAQAFRNMVSQERRTFLSVEQQEEEGGSVTLGAFGPYNGKQLWRRPTTLKNIPGSILQLAKAPLKDLRSNKTNLPDTALNVNTKVRDRACHAFIMQATLNAIAAGDGLIKSIFEAHKIAQYLELGLITKQDVLEQYCTCLSYQDQAKTEHICTMCNDIQLCTIMVVQQTNEGPLMLCRACGSRDASASSQRSFSRDSADFIKYRVAEIYRKDRRFHNLPWTQEELTKALVENNTSKDDKSVWYDDYRDGYVSLSAKTWPPELGIDPYSAGQHPYSMSVEKPYSRILRADGQVTLHDPDNVTLTMVCINLLKGNDPPSVLPVLKKALQLKQHHASREVCAGYAAEVADKWEVLERASDNLRMITSITPRTRNLRVRSAPTKEQDRRERSQWKSGRWDGKSLPSRLKAVFRTRGEEFKGAELWRFLKLYPIWTDDDWKKILCVVSQIENDRTPNGFNKHNLPKLPRKGKNGNIVWLWKEDSCPHDVDKEYIFHEFLARLYTMVTFCNRQHPTTESPATLFIEYVVQWFENGGKCPFFGFIMTPFMGHPFNFSFGRGIEYHDGSGRLIKPGAPMHTGCKALSPADIFKDYDRTLRTVIVESWKSNVLRFQWPVSKPLIGMLEAAVLALADSTKWYAKLGSLDDYAVIALPKSYKDRSAWEASFSKKGTVVHDADEDITTHDAEADDQETAMYMSLDEDILSLQKDQADATDPVALDTAAKISSWEERGAQYKKALEDHPGSSQWLDEAIHTMHLMTSNTVSSPPNQQKVPGSSGPIPDKESTSARDLDEELKRIEADLFGGKYAFALGNASVVQAYGDLRAAKEIDDASAFSTAVSTLEAAVGNVQQASGSGTGPSGSNTPGAGPSGQTETDPDLYTLQCLQSELRMCEDNLTGKLVWANQDPAVQRAYGALRQAVERGDEAKFMVAKTDMQNAILALQATRRPPNAAAVFTLDPYAEVHRTCTYCGDKRNKASFFSMPDGTEKCTVCELREMMGYGGWYVA